MLNFAHANEASKANNHENKKIIYRPPFMKKVYADLLLSKFLQALIVRFV